MIVRLPIVVYDTSSAALRSCEVGADRARTDRTITSSPIVVWPLTTTCASSFVRSPIVTYSPTMQYGPISTPLPMFARGMHDRATDGSRSDHRCRIDRVVRGARATSPPIENISSPLHASLPSTRASAVDPADVAPRAQHAASMSRRSPGMTGRRNFTLSIPDEVRPACAPCRPARGPSSRRAAPALRSLARPGSNGLPGKWPGEQRLVGGDVLVAAREASSARVRGCGRSAASGSGAAGSS